MLRKAIGYVGEWLHPLGTHCIELVIPVACLGRLLLLPFYVVFGIDQAALMEEFKQLYIRQLKLVGS